MQLINYTPFTAITWEVLAPDGREQGVLLVRGCFALSVGNAESHLLLHPAAEQGGWFGEDQFFGPPDQSEFRYAGTTLVISSLTSHAPI